jgi:hypothetical protein
VPAEKLPPILVHRATNRIIDGMHRLEAAKLRGDETISVRFAVSWLLTSHYLTVPWPRSPASTQRPSATFGGRRRHICRSCPSGLDVTESVVR